MIEKEQAKKRSLQHHALSMLVGAVGLVLIFGFSRPSDVSLSFLLVPFLLIGFTSYSFFSLLFSRVVTLQKRRLNASLVSGLLLALLVLSSLDQLSPLDILAASLFLLIAVAYIQYMHFLD